MKKSRKEKIGNDPSQICKTIHGVFEDFDKENELLTKRRTVKLLKYKNKKFDKVWARHRLEEGSVIFPD